MLAEEVGLIAFSDKIAPVNGSVAISGMNEY